MLYINLDLLILNKYTALDYPPKFRTDVMTTNLMCVRESTVKNFFYL